MAGEYGIQRYPEGTVPIHLFLGNPQEKGPVVRVVILQPSFLPWKGYFHQIERADIFVFYDDVQFDKHGWRNRNRIKTPQGAQWISVDVLTKGNFGQLIKDVAINNDVNWNRRIWNAITMNYRKCPYFEDYAGCIEEALFKKWDLLSEIDIYLTERIAGILNCGTEFHRSSRLPVAGDRMSRIINICKYFGADRYLTGPSARNYLVDGLFLDNGIVLEYQNYDYPSYPQRYGEFIGDVSIIDLLFNCGPSSSRFIWGDTP